MKVNKDKDLKKAKESALGQSVPNGKAPVTDTMKQTVHNTKKVEGIVKL